jgi:hypothetical protein
MENDSLPLAEIEALAPACERQGAKTRVKNYDSVFPV